MEPVSERRQNYPDLLAEMIKIRHEQEQQMTLLREHIRETQEITDLWLHSRWLIGTLKFAAVSAATLAAGWFAMKQLLGGTG